MKVALWTNTNAPFGALDFYRTYERTNAESREELAEWLEKNSAKMDCDPDLDYVDQLKQVLAYLRENPDFVVYLEDECYGRWYYYYAKGMSLRRMPTLRIEEIKEDPDLVWTIAEEFCKEWVKYYRLEGDGRYLVPIEENER